MSNDPLDAARRSTSDPLRPAAKRGARCGPLIILSGPAGSGKSTVTAAAGAGDLPLRQSVSATTRPPRPGERDGVHYHFWTRERFEQEMRAGGFLEWAEVHGNYYGTLRERGRAVPAARHRRHPGHRRAGGGAGAGAAVPTRSRSFCRPRPGRSTSSGCATAAHEDEATIARRLAAARQELARAGEYQFQVINDDLDDGRSSSLQGAIVSTATRFEKERPCWMS